MTRIRVVPEQLRSLSAEFQQIAGDLKGTGQRVSAAFGGLDWESRQRTGVSGQVGRACDCANGLAAQAEALARYLATKAQAFEEADRQGVDGVGQIGVSLGKWMQGLLLGPGSRLAFPDRIVGATWNLGGVLAPLPGVPSVLLPLAGGSATLVGLGFLRELVLPDWLKRLINWLRGRGWVSDSEPTPPAPGRTPFGKLLDQPPPGEETHPQPAPTTPAPPAAQPTTRSPDQWWHDVPSQSQQGLTYGKQKTAYGCAPTATSMILDYWHARDPNNKTMSAQELLDINAGQGVFNSRGMSPSNIHDEVQALGYGVVEDHTNSDFSALREAVAQGPVIAIVKANVGTEESRPVSTLRPDGSTTHAVVVTGISPDGSHVRINDPWTGQTHTYSWEEFSKAWGADFGENAPRNSFVVIRPS